MDAPRAQITGLVLAGGQGRRVGGQDKGRMMWGGSPLAEHALARLRPQVGALLPALETFLASGERRMRTWLQTLNAAAVPFDDAAAFANLNRLEDFAHGER